MAARNTKVQSVIKSEVSMGQLIGVALSLLVLIATSYVNLQIKVSQGEIRQNNTDLTLTEIKVSVKEIQITQGVILRELGALGAKVEVMQRRVEEQSNK